MIGIDLDTDSRINDVLEVSDQERVAEDLQINAKKSTLQRKHNTQLLGFILRLQGNIQVWCRVRSIEEYEFADKMIYTPDPDRSWTRI